MTGGVHCDDILTRVCASVIQIARSILLFQTQAADTISILIFLDRSENDHKSIHSPERTQNLQEQNRDNK